MAHLDILLINIQSPENVGSIYRLAFQFGARTIYRYQCASPGKTNTYKTERHIPIHEVESLSFLDQYPHPKYLLETGGVELASTENISPYLVGVGNERYGVSDADKAYFDIIYSLKAPNRVSYNVSTALGIGLYHLTYC